MYRKFKQKQLPLDKNRFTSRRNEIWKERRLCALKLLVYSKYRHVSVHKQITGYTIKHRDLRGTNLSSQAANL